MKQGKTLEALGTELQRQRAARQDFVATSMRDKDYCPPVMHF